MHINASTLVKRHKLELTDHGLDYISTEGFGGHRFFRFDQVDAVLRSPQMLAFQVGRETFSIPIRNDKEEHRAFAEQLVAQVAQTVRSA